MSSHYTRSDANGVATFNVAPAHYPLGLTNFAALLISVFFIWASTLPTDGFRFFGYVLLIVGLILLIAALIKIGVALRENEKRKPYSIAISDKELASGSERFPLATVRAFQAGHAEDGKPLATQYAPNPVNMAVMIGTNARLRSEAAQRHVRYQVLVRLAGDSRLRLVANALTEQTAQALAVDLGDEVQRRSGS